MATNRFASVGSEVQSGEGPFTGGCNEGVACGYLTRQEEDDQIMARLKSVDNGQVRGAG